MAKQSAGLMMYRRRDAGLEVFLVHPGGPFWAKKDRGAWCIPKGGAQGGEWPLDAARREFTEETGFAAEPPFLELGAVTQTSGKIVTAWAFEGDCDPAALVSNTCEVEWPPRSGRMLVVPEVDCGRWFSLNGAREHIRKAQEPFLDRLTAIIQAGPKKA